MALESRLKNTRLSNEVRNLDIESSNAVFTLERFTEVLEFIYLGKVRAAEILRPEFAAQ